MRLRTCVHPSQPVDFQIKLVRIKRAIESIASQALAGAVAQATGNSMLLVLALLCWVPPAMGEAPQDVLPDAERDNTILTPDEFFGFAIGSRHLRHDQIVAYWEYLDSASDRVQVIQYARSHGRRPLQVAAISSPSNLDDLSAHAKRRRRLTSGQYAGDWSNELLVMYMGYSVHGDEASAVNAAPLVAYHLASSLEPEFVQQLQSAIYLIDPALNPDGVDRFANWSNENRGLFASPSSMDREHVQPWPGGRTNYYWFDLNRDWLPLVHPESQGRLTLFHEWKPNVVLDFHEMSGNSSYFFQPGIPARNNPLSPNRNLQLTRIFAKEHAARMDAANELFFTEERFDDFYPGKGSTYPDLHGAVGILFEQGSTRGLQLQNDRSSRHFRDTVANQVRTSLSSLQVANEIRDSLLQYQVEFYADSRNRATKDSTRAYLLSGSPSRLRAAARLLRRHQIELYQPVEELRIHDRLHLPHELLIVPTDQPEYVFLRSLMEPLQSFRENIFYDVSAWHLPSAFDLEVARWDATLPPSWTEQRWQGGRASAEVADEPREPLGFIFSPVPLEAPQLVVGLQRAGAAIRVNTKPIQLDSDKTWPAGSFLLLKQPNEKHWNRLTKVIRTRASTLGIELGVLTSGMTSRGPDLGSDTMLVLPKATPLLVVGEATRSYSAGALWHYFDTRLRLPTTLVDSHRFGGIDLDDMTVVILPEGGYSDWGTREVEQLEQYLRSGGTVVAVASAIDWLANRSLLQFDPAITSGHVSDEKSEVEEQAKSSLRRLPFGEARETRALESIAGAFLRTSVDVTHPLAFGFPDATVPVFRDHTHVYPVPINPYELVATYDRVVAGYVSQKNRKALQSTAAVWAQNVGRGRVICLADNPVFRGYVRSSERFLSNAVLLGPVVSIPSSPDEATEEADEH